MSEELNEGQDDDLGMPELQVQHWTVLDAHDNVHSTGFTTELPPVPDGYRLVHLEAPSLDAYLTPTGWERRPERPGGSFVWEPALKVWVDARTLEHRRMDKLAEINGRFRIEARALTDGYPEEERSTWHMQEAEALAWQSNPDAPTPYLDAVADARGIDYEDMRGKTLGNVLLFRAASALLVGTRQQLRDQAEDAQTAEELEAITWPT